MIADLQRRSWSAAGRGEVLAEVSDTDLANAWTQAIVAPPMAHFRVLIAHDGSGDLTGFAAIGPSDDPDAQDSDGEIAEFSIDPQARGQGHGSRLLAAAVDTLRQDGFHRAVWWVMDDDQELLDFAQGAGWGLDGAHRQIGAESAHEATRRVSQLRLHTDIALPVASGGSAGAQ